VRKLLALSAALVGALAIGLVPAGAITDGTPDVNDEYDHVGIMVASIDGAPQWRCSGTLLSPTVFLTAGHCTDGADHVEVWFRNGYPNQIAAVPDGYPFTGEVGGTPYTHPDYDPNAFFLRDVGVVVLDAPVAADTYGVLPGLNSLDALKTKRGKQDVTFTAVGYGLQKSFPDATAWKDSAVRTRMIAHPKLNQINTPGFTGDFSMLLSNNAHTGGTCFGDSGGPNFLGDSNVVAGVTSFGLQSTCAGTGGVFRMDRSWSLDWVGSFLTTDS
jgi:V8-like Glu-specific endopeptidase